MPIEIMKDIGAFSELSWIAADYAKRGRANLGIWEM